MNITRILGILTALTMLSVSAPAYGAGGELAVSVRGIDPGSVPRGANRVAMMEIVLNASCDADVRVDALSLRHGGLGAATDIHRVYLHNGVRRLSRAASFSQSDQTARLRIAGLTVPRCGTETVYAYADFSVDATSGGEHRVTLHSTADISSDAVTVTLSSTGGTATARAVPANSGTITVEYLRLNRTVGYGANKVISRLRLDADNESDHLIRSITLTNDGSARDDDLRNLRIEASGRTVSGRLRSLDGDIAVFTFDPPLRLGRNASRVLQVRADVRASRRRTIRLLLEEPSDLDATIQKQRGARFQ